MTSVDQFESVFKAAAKPVYRYEPIGIQKVLVITDLPEKEALAFGDDLQQFLAVLRDQPVLAWRCVQGSEYASVGELLALVEKEAPDLICTYRHLHSDAWKWPYSLGEHLDVLTQATSPPVLVLPHPEAGRAHQHANQNTDRVMAVTDHITSDDRLVNFAAGFVQRDGRLFLTHIEDERSFERTIETISRIPSMDTETAREEIRKRLLLEPKNYIDSCAGVLRAESKHIRVEEIVTMGHRLSDYKSLIESHKVDLLVFNTKDEDQLAIHGVTYPLAVELRQIPLLML